MKPWLVAWLLGTFAICMLPVATESRAQAARRVPVFFHIAKQQGEQGKPVADEEFIRTQLTHANAIYGAIGIELVNAGQATLPSRHAALTSREDRDALTRHLRAGVINCMLVAALMDVDEPGRVRRGVHWRARKQPTRHFVIVSAISGPYVLAHELGHFFGNRAHSETPGNLMSYQLTDDIPVLTPEQVAKVNSTLARLLTTQELRLLDTP